MDVPKPEKRSLPRRIVRSVLTYSGVGIVTLIILELVGRLFNPAGVAYYPETAAYLDTMIIEEPIGYRNRPNLRGKFHGVPVAINSLG